MISQTIVLAVGFGDARMESRKYMFEICNDDHITGWSANAILADKRYFDDIPCHAIATHLIEIEEPFPLSDGWVGPAKCIRSTREGIVEDSILLSPADLRRRRQDIRKAHVGDLLVSGSGKHLFAFVVPEEFDGAAVRSGSMVFTTDGTMPTDLYLRFIQALFQSRTYKEYLADRLISPAWYWDFADFKVPTIEESRMEGLLNRVGRGDVENSLKVRLNRIREEVSQIYWKNLGMRPRKMNRCGTISEIEMASRGETWSPNLLLDARFVSEFYPSCSLSEVVSYSKDRYASVSETGMLKNIRCNRNMIDEKYLEGLIACDFLPKGIRRLASGLGNVSYAYYQLRETQVPLPPMNEQIKLAGMTESLINEIKILSADIFAYSRLSKRAADLIDREIFHAVA